MRNTQIELPQLAVEFLGVHPGKERKRTVKLFCRWMAKWKLNLKDIKQAHIESFIQNPLDKEISSDAQNNYRKNLAKYLAWLYRKGLLRFNPQPFFGRPIYFTPQIVQRFIRSLEPTLKDSTLAGYLTSLRAFHYWIDEQKLSLASLQRGHTSEWLISLSKAGFFPKTINTRIIHARIYLCWLCEQGIVSVVPDELLRNSDRVKEPKYLPRPFPPDVDKILQERLARAEDVYSQGLILMRKTGLRIGELVSLENHCVRRDYRGNNFLKVPLGKLNTERLVPIDDSTLELINRLRATNGISKEKYFLIETITGKKTGFHRYYAQLKQACEGLETHGPAVSHRLRHTYATSLLNAGMNLVSVMRLLGHNDPCMTLRYAAITQETVVKEYFEAISRIEHRYTELLQLEEHTSSETDPVKMLDDVTRIIQNLGLENKGAKTYIQSIVKRISRLQADVRKLRPNPTSTV